MPTNRSQGGGADLPASGSGVPFLKRRDQKWNDEAANKASLAVIRKATFGRAARVGIALGAAAAMSAHLSLSLAMISD
jgi:hypothetical protein